MEFEDLNEYDSGNPFMDPNHPIFAPLNAALIERLDRKIAEVTAEIKFVSCTASEYHIELKDMKSRV